MEKFKVGEMVYLKAKCQGNRDDILTKIIAIQDHSKPFKNVSIGAAACVFCDKHDKRGWIDYFDYWDTDWGIDFPQSYQLQYRIKWIWMYNLKKLD